VTQVSQPYVPGNTVYWTKYTYDGLGRTLRVLAPDGASTTTYGYSGNITTITDPATKWKKYTYDVFGNLTYVNEPNPAGGNDYVC
jgi:YD repeat-containing protein